MDTVSLPEACCTVVGRWGPRSHLLPSPGQRRAVLCVGPFENHWWRLPQHSFGARGEGGRRSQQRRTLGLKTQPSFSKLDEQSGGHTCPGQVAVEQLVPCSLSAAPALSSPCSRQPLLSLGSPCSPQPPAHPGLVETRKSSAAPPPPVSICFLPWAPPSDSAFPPLLPQPAATSLAFLSLPLSLWTLPLSHIRSHPLAAHWLSTILTSQKPHWSRAVRGPHRPLQALAASCAGGWVGLPHSAPKALRSTQHERETRMQALLREGQGKPQRAMSMLAMRPVKSMESEWELER